VFGTEGYVFSDVAEFGDRLTFNQQPFGGWQLDPAIVFDRAISRATFELRNSIRYPDFTALHRRLAIEAIRNGFDPNDENAGWQALRTNLNLERATIQSFKDAADEQRHGKNVPQTWEQRRHAMQIAWEIVHRYCVYRPRSGSRS